MFKRVLDDWLNVAFHLILFTLLCLNRECVFMYCKCAPPRPTSPFIISINKDKAEDPRLPEAQDSVSTNDETQVHKKQHTHIPMRPVKHVIIAVLQ